MADMQNPQAQNGGIGAGGNQQTPGQPGAPQQPSPQPFGAWPPQQPGEFREFSSQGGWPQQPPAGPTGYPPQQPGAYPQGYWQPGAAPPSVQSGYAPVPGQPTGYYGAPPPPPNKNSSFLFISLAGLAALVILVPLILIALSQGQSNTPNNPSQTTTNNPTATPTPPAGVFTPDGTAPTAAECMSTINIPCYSPEEIQKAFGLTSLYQQGYDGKGQTIVIIGAGNTPNIQNDLKAFDKAWGLPDPPSFKIIQPYGPPTPYNCQSVGEPVDGLQLENTLDVEWSHAMAPGANIILIIGPNKERTYFPVPADAPLCGLYDLEEPVQYALDNHLGNVVTISYGGSELGADTDTSVDKANEQKEYNAADSIFKSAVSQGVTVLASSGDSGSTNENDLVNHNSYWKTPNVSWPASDPYVVAVGGTSLTISDAQGDYGSEIAWNNGGASGGGLSVLYKEPSYQQKYVSNQSMLQGERGVPDVAFPADVNYTLYESADPSTIDVSKWPHWNLIGGTSAASPCWAGIIAIADQMSTQAGGGPLGYIQPGLYSLQGKDFHDITQGDNNYAKVAGYQAGPGYDLVTGWGTPMADQLVPALVQAVQQVGNKP